ncbi:MAG: hypothetical protein EGQ17_02135 [Lachnospiraceae bacterium]|nr:hypothetical protein [Lachnospiraceae bacterium]
MTLVIMAAGMGSRFGGLKQVEPVGPNGEFILDYSIYDAIKAGYKKVVFIIKEENYDLFRETIGKRIESKIDVSYAFQKIEDVPNSVDIPASRVKPWGTSHAILSAKKYVNEPFTVINADDFYGFDPYKKMKEFWDRAEAGGRKSFRHDELDLSYVLAPHGGYLVPYLDGIQKVIDESG